MRFEESLDQLLTDSSHIRVLRALWRNSSRRLTGREVATQAHLSAAQTARVLLQLQNVGLASSESAGRAFLWKWNTDHIWASRLEVLFEAEGGLKAQLVQDLSQMLRGLPIKRGVLFGSFSRGQERDDSDIDIFVETATIESAELVRRRLSERRSELWKKYGNPLSPMILTTEEVRRIKGAKLLRSIEAEGIPVVA
jgi:predicted nucleotidyltransferase